MQLSSFAYQQKLILALSGYSVGSNSSPYLRFAQVVAPFSPLSLRTGGFKWTLLYLRFAQVVAPFSPLPFRAGGFKWTRTIDLTLIRRVL